MRYVDADKLYPDCMTKDGKLAISQSQLANAPIVPLPDFKEGYKQAIRDGKTNFARPQGEWIFRQGVTAGGYYKCNKCGEVERAEKNFCSNCGADMRGKA